MPNGNRLSVPELEGQIATLQAQLRILIADQQPRSSSMYVCVRCSAMYQSVWGCGCPLFPGEKRQAAPGVETVDERLSMTVAEVLRIVDANESRQDIERALIANLPSNGGVKTPDESKEN